MQRQPIYPDIEVRAAAARLFVAAFSAFPSVARRFVGGYYVGEGDAPPNRPGPAFIPLDAWLVIFEKVQAEIGPSALFQVGQRVISNPHFTEGPRTLEEALLQIDIAYHKSHRKGGVVMLDPTTGRMLEGIGHYRVTERGHKRISLTSDTPYPCPLEHGIVSSIASTFEPRAIVVHDDVNRCRMKGGDRCAFVVGW